MVNIFPAIILDIKVFHPAENVIQLPKVELDGTKKE